MDIISDIELAILGLLCEKPQYGYEIEKTIEERNMRNWTKIGFSSIYYVLKKLEKKDLVDSQTEAVKGKPSRKIFQPTEKGRVTAKSNVKRLLSSSERIVQGLDLGIINSPLLTTEEIIECLNNYLVSLRETENYLNEGLSTVRSLGLPSHVVALSTRPLAHTITERQWVEEYIESLRKEEK